MLPNAYKTHSLFYEAAETKPLYGQRDEVLQQLISKGALHLEPALVREAKLLKRVPSCYADPEKFGQGAFAPPTTNLVGDLRSPTKLDGCGIRSKSEDNHAYSDRLLCRSAIAWSPEKYEDWSNQKKQSEIREIDENSYVRRTEEFHSTRDVAENVVEASERPRSKSNPNPRIYYRNKHNNVVPQEGLMIGGEYITEEQFHEFYMKKQSDMKEWDDEFLKETIKTKKTESIFGYLYRILVYDTQNNKTKAIKEKYKETLDNLEVRTPSWPLFVEKEEYNKDVLNQQKITIEKKLQDDLEQSTIFKWHHLHLRKTTTPMSEKSAENSPPLTPYFTKKSKISP